mmetsp:Transcript_9972/g.18935  ORF Transcript_9972/g.18935 Transcript_9972/m.18935 type:complete len:122 (-) Transcript_9972:49-414(-)
MIELIGSAMARNCANDVYQQSGLTPEDVDVVELHDCFSANELITYEALQLCGEGEGGKLIESGNATFGGKYVVNPSGGLISKGHPLGVSTVCVFRSFRKFNHDCVGNWYSSMCRTKLAASW